MAALRELAAHFGIEVDDGQLKNLNETIDHVKSNFQALVGGALVYKVGEFFYELTRGAADAADELAKTAIKIGVNAQELQKWQYAADLAGVSAETLTNTLGILSKNAEAASDTTSGKVSDMGKAFKQLGIEVKDASGNIKDPSTLLGEVATGLDGVTNETEKTALALKILGRGGKELLPLFKGGAAAIEATKAELAELGAAFEDDFMDQSEEANDNISRFNYSMKGLRNEIAKFLLPILNRFAVWGKQAAVWIRKIAEKTNIVKAALLTLSAVLVGIGAAFTAAFAGPLLTIGLFAAGFAAVVLIVDELITLFEGGDTVIGEFIDSLLGVGAAQAMVQTLKETWEGIVFLIKEAWYALQKFLSIAGDVGGKTIGAVKDFGKFLGIDTEEERKPRARPGVSQDDLNRLWRESKKDSKPVAERYIPDAQAPQQTTVAPVSNTQVTINANGVDPKKVYDIAQKAARDNEQRSWDNAISALTQKAGT